MLQRASGHLREEPDHVGYQARSEAVLDWRANRGIQLSFQQSAARNQ